MSIDAQMFKALEEIAALKEQLTASQQAEWDSIDSIVAYNENLIEANRQIDMLVEQVNSMVNQLDKAEDKLSESEAKVKGLEDMCHAVTMVCNGSSVLEYLDQYRAADSMCLEEQIAALEATNARYREALEKIATNVCYQMEGSFAGQTAREALEGGEG